MKPFDSANEAINWIKQTAVGEVDVYIFNSTYILTGTKHKPEKSILKTEDWYFF